MKKGQREKWLQFRVTFWRPKQSTDGEAEIRSRWLKVFIHECVQGRAASPDTSEMMLRMVPQGGQRTSVHIPSPVELRSSVKPFSNHAILSAAPPQGP